uniref:NYN domain-containing protein n=1 Tax=Bionectria ochroleuca TaxID=29856 RepID=A0A8H7N6J8_BIOOC
MSSDMNENCMIFVGDSNVWIEAQKFAASGKSRLPKLEDCDQDPRYRVNIGKLVSRISNGRSVEGAFLYGSRPPPNDAVWNSYERFGFKVNVYNRANDGKEKQVDSSMATDISRQATKLEVGAKYDEEIKQQLNNMTFIVVSGDRDMLPPIIATLECGIPVEVWAWKSGISNEHKRREGGNLRVYYLDQIANRIFFTNTRSTRTGKIVEVDKTVVLCNPNDKDSGMDFLEASVSSCLLENCPFLFYITRSRTETELFVEFPNLKNVERMIFEVRDLFKDDWTVESWPESSSRLNKETSVTREKGTMFQPCVKKRGERNSALATEQTKSVDGQAKPWSGWDLPKPFIGQSWNDDNDTVAFNDWETVKSRNDPKGAHRRAMQRTQACPYGQHCRKAAACGNHHTKEEEKLFEKSPNQNFTKWKTSRCRNFPYCRRGHNVRLPTPMPMRGARSAINRVILKTYVVLKLGKRSNQ